MRSSWPLLEKEKPRRIPGVYFSWQLFHAIQNTGILLMSIPRRRFATINKNFISKFRLIETGFFVNIEKGSSDFPVGRTILPTVVIASPAKQSPRFLHEQSNFWLQNKNTRRLLRRARNDGWFLPIRKPEEPKWFLRLFCKEVSLDHPSQVLSGREG